MPQRPDVLVRPLAAGDRRFVRATLVRNWSATTVARRGELIEARDLPGFVAVLDGRRTGLVLVQIRPDDYEIVAVATGRRRRGVGTALLDQCVADARRRGCRRLWLVTTNDNIAAIAFYQRWGMDLAEFRRHGVRASRAVKPSIPHRDSEGVPIDHELEFELLLDPSAAERDAPTLGPWPCWGRSCTRQRCAPAWFRGPG